MAARDVPVTTRSSERVSIDVLGGRATTAMDASQISNEDFREALKQSILKSGLFREVVDGKAGAYQLSAFIGEMGKLALR